MSSSIQRSPKPIVFQGTSISDFEVKKNGTKIMIQAFKWHPSMQYPLENVMDVFFEKYGGEDAFYGAVIGSDNTMAPHILKRVVKMLLKEMGYVITKNHDILPSQLKKLWTMLHENYFGDLYCNDLDSDSDSD